MKIKGEFILREIAGDNILVPVGDTALNINGIIALDSVGLVIWQAVEKGMNKTEILQQILDRYEIDAKTAEEDLDEFLENLSSNGLLEKE